MNDLHLTGNLMAQKIALESEQGRSAELTAERTPYLSRNTYGPASGFTYEYRLNLFPVFQSHHELLGILTLMTDPDRTGPVNRVVVLKVISPWF